MRYWCVFALLCPLSVLAQGSADLSWTPPAAYDNGDPLDPATDLIEYRLYDGTEVIATPAPGTQSFTVDDLGGFGDHDLSMTAVATNGNESIMSNVVVVTVPDNRQPGPPTNFLAQLFAWIADRWERWFG